MKLLTKKLKENTLGLIMSKAEKRHDKELSDILLHPKILDLNCGKKIIGLQNIVISGTMNFIQKGELICQPDGLMFDAYGNAYLLEYKTHDSEHNRSKAYRQLHNAIIHYRTYLGKDKIPIVIYAHDKNKGELIK